MSSAEQHALLEQLAYQAWLDRGQPIGSPEIDWQSAHASLGASLRGADATATTSDNPPLLSEALVVEYPVASALQIDPVSKPRRSTVKAKARPAARATSRSSAAMLETPPLEVPPSTPAPPQPTPTQAATA
jgi:hypothetical protein